MKTKITLLILLLGFIIKFSNAQEYCAAPTNFVEQNFSSLSRMLTANPASEGMICLNVFFHIVRNNDGSGGINDYEVNAIISNLYGNQIKEYKVNSFNTKGLKKGVYIFKVQIKNDIVLKKIIIQ